MADIYEKIEAFIAKRQEAEEKGERYFTCPLCGGEAHWTRISGHLHAACKGCGFRMAE